MYLNAYQADLLGRIMATLAEPHTEAEVRAQLGRHMLELLNAQHYASYVWDAGAGRFDMGLSINMDPANLGRYERYYQFHDPITLRLQQHRRAVRVNDVMRQADLKRTEFFNDFLARDGLYWGINLYAWAGDQNIGDMRIWRDRRREDFSRDEAQLLDLVRPALTAALLRCRIARGDAPHEAPSRPSSPACGDESAALARLSPREGHVARLVAQGLTDKAIAQRLAISVTTVRTHLDNAFRKLGVANRVMLARRLGG